MAQRRHFSFGLISGVQSFSFGHFSFGLISGVHFSFGLISGVQSFSFGHFSFGLIYAKLKFGHLIFFLTITMD
jgi:hypothetical protein